MKLKHFSLIFSLIGISVLYFISNITQPALISLKEITDYEGKEIKTQGIVIHYYSTKYGNQLIEIREENFTTTIFLEKEMEVEYGDIVQVIGQVQKFNNEWEIIVENEKNFKILEKWHSISMPLWQLAHNPGRYLGLNVNVTGYIESISNSYFHLADFEENCSILVFYRLSENLTLYAGCKVNISAVFTFDEKNFRYTLELFSPDHKIYITKDEGI